MRILISVIILIGSALTAVTLSSPPSVKLQSFTLNRNEAPGGIEIIGTLTLSRSAPKHGTTVTIDPVDPSIADVPTSIQFTQGQSVKQFTIIGVPRCDQTQVDLRCTLGISLIQTVVIREPHFFITLDPNPVIGGNPVIGTVTLDGPAPNCP